MITLRAIMGQYGPLWASMGQYGPLWASMATFSRTRKSKQLDKRKVSSRCGSSCIQLL